MNGDRFRINDLTSEIDKRMEDSFWDKRMARSVVRKESSKRRAVGIASAASLILIFSGVFFYQYQKQSNRNGIAESKMELNTNRTLNETQLQVVDINQFPFNEEQELTMVSLEELYGE